MPSISNKWIDKLDMLPARDYITLTKAILRDEPEPQITPKYQPLASDIYADIGKLKRDNEYQKKHRLKSDSNLTVRRMSDECQTNVRQEEKREAPPPCSPSSSPPHPLNITPIIPHPKRKEKNLPLTRARARALKAGDGAGETALRNCGRSTRRKRARQTPLQTTREQSRTA